MPQRTRVTVLIDSNAVWNDWLLDGVAWNKLKLLAVHGLVDVCMPEVVVQEVTRGYKGELNDLVSALKKLGLWKLGRLLALDITANVKDLKETAARQIDAYEPELRARLNELSIRIAPVPAVDQQTLLTRALQNLKPFDGVGKNGFRDALIWHTVLEACLESRKILFVTNNTKDFCGPGKDVLHEVLAAEINEVGLSTVTIVSDLHAAVRHLKEIDGLDTDLDLAAFPVVDLTREQVEAITMRACERLTDQTALTSEPQEHAFFAYGDFSDFSTIIEDEATVSDVVPDMSTLDWDITGRDSGGRPMIAVSVDATVSLDGMAFKSDYYAADGSTAVLDSDWNDHYMWVETYHKGRLMFEVYLTPDAAGVEEVELVDAEERLA